MEQIKLGDTPEQLGQITAADAMMVDGKIVTRDDYRALIAQVEVLQSWVKQAAELVNVDAGTAIDWLIDAHHQMLKDAKTTPAACLAQVQADAGRAGWMACARVYCTDEHFTPHPLTGMTAIKGADQYAERIRQGGAV